jgi:SAM-dependent methyltransferase
MRVQAQRLPVPAAAFDEVAAEYYDPSRHPTCANFRFATALRLEGWLEHYRDGCLCEVGCGKSLAAEILSRHNSSLPHVMLTDDSPLMLEYSSAWQAHGAQLKLASADELPFRSGSLQCLVSCLGDPYNTSAFWRESARVLGPHGTVFYSTPAYNWSRTFRQSETAHQAEFELADGRRVMIPSYIYPEVDQIRVVEEAGLRIKEISKVTLKDLHGQPLSPKLLLRRGLDAPVVTCFTAVKA